jgi:PKHD-type hydroxylase
MKYIGLYNQPAVRSRVTYPWVWWDGMFSAEELSMLCQLGEHGTADATVFGDAKGEARSADNNIRVSKTRFFPFSEEHAWIFDRFNRAIQEINGRWFGFDLNGYEKFQYTEYHASEKGHYGWHIDMCLGDTYLPADMHEPRKLSLSLILNEPGVDYQGGDFQFKWGEKEDIAVSAKGRILAFPSWMMHRVTPVTEGMRKSIVIWVTGPKFQ